MVFAQYLGRKEAGVVDQRPSGCVPDPAEFPPHAISLASTALTVSWSRAASRSSPQRQRAEIDRLRAEITHLKEEMAIKDSRWGRHSPRRRPHYGPIHRMRILRLRAAVMVQRPLSALQASEEWS